MLKFPEDNARFRWTRHIKNKMVYYNLSGSQIMRIFQSPQRREEGILKGTIAAMKTKKSSSATTKGPKETEVWIMYVINSKQKINKLKPEGEKHKLSVMGYKSPVSKSKVTMISAWRYPGKTKPGERPPVPEGLMEELIREGVI